jgi:hypothetical protein
MGMMLPRSDIPQRDELPFGSGAELIQRIAEKVSLLGNWASGVMSSGKLRGHKKGAGG